MSTIKLSSITNKAKTSGPVIVGVTSSTATGYAQMASGDNSERVGIESGSIRYNSTAKLLEFYDGTQWNFILPAEESANALGVFGGGGSPKFSGGYANIMDYVTISTTGDAIYFGDLTVSRGHLDACSSTTRGVFGAGIDAVGYVYVNLMDYITISAKGNATDFGDLNTPCHDISACSSSTRGIFAGGELTTSPFTTNVIDYITIATTGNASDFGDLTQSRQEIDACSSSTRGVFGGGATGTGPTYVPVNTIDYITISTLSNALDFGDLIPTRSDTASCSSSIRGIFYGGRTAPSYTAILNIDYITIATTGNTQYFGDGIATRTGDGSCSSSTRGVFGGYCGGSNQKIIDYIIIATTGNSSYFGDLTEERYGTTACSNNHGGLL